MGDEHNNPKNEIRNVKSNHVISLTTKLFLTANTKLV